MTTPTLKPVDELTPHELRIECLERMGWSDVGMADHDYLDPITGDVRQYLRLEGQPPDGDCEEACPDPTLDIADAMEIIESYHAYRIEKRTERGRTIFVVRLPRPKSAIDKTGHIAEWSEDRCIAITKAAVAALREKQQ